MAIRLLLLFLSISFNLCGEGPRAELAHAGMVTSATQEATKAGLDVLKSGGNAADAAVATLFALSVSEPYSAGLGGGGFLLYYAAKENKVYSLDFRERAPASAHERMYFKEGILAKDLSIDGHLAVAVPHTVEGIKTFHEKFGSKKFKDLVQPAIKLAKKGIVVNDQLIENINERLKALNQSTDAKQIFTKNGKTLKLGEKLIQKDLAKTLALIAKNPNDFYEGKIANLLVKEMTQHGGIISLQDLKERKVTWRKPICGMYQDANICSMGPPSSGGIVLHQTLKMLANVNFQEESWHSLKGLHLLAETLRISYADRAAYLGDPDQVSIPVEKLLSDDYLKAKSKEIDLSKAVSSLSMKNAETSEQKKIAEQYESKQTTHFNVVDKDHNAVSLTFTINGPFGSGVVAAGTGIILNNEMDDFALSLGTPNLYGLVGGKANVIASKKIPLSSMTPIIATKNDALYFCAGSPGGSTIITTGLQIALNILHYNMNAQAAVSTKRIHMQWLPDKLFYEPFSLDQTTILSLKKMGHTLEQRNHWGNASVIVAKPDGIIEGASDPRGRGYAQGF